MSLKIAFEKAIFSSCFACVRKLLDSLLTQKETKVLLRFILLDDRCEWFSDITQEILDGYNSRNSRQR